RDRLASARDHGLLARERAHVLDRRVDDLRVPDRGAQAHVDDHLLEAGHLHGGLVRELLGQRGRDALVVLQAQARPVALGERGVVGAGGGRGRDSLALALALAALLVAAAALGLSAALGLTAALGLAALLLGAAVLLGGLVLVLGLV